MILLELLSLKNEFNVFILTRLHFYFLYNLYIYGEKINLNENQQNNQSEISDSHFWEVSLNSSQFRFIYG